MTDLKQDKYWWKDIERYRTYHEYFFVLIDDSKNSISILDIINTSHFTWGLKNELL